CVCVQACQPRHTVDGADARVQAGRVTGLPRCIAAVILIRHMPGARQANRHSSGWRTNAVAVLELLRVILARARLTDSAGRATENSTAAVEYVGTDALAAYLVGATAALARRALERTGARRISGRLVTDADSGRAKVQRADLATRLPRSALRGIAA